MVTRRAAKQKGSNFEYDVQYSLKDRFPDIYRTAERGYQRQFDLCSDEHKVKIECKAHKALTYNQLFKLFEKLQNVEPKEYMPILVFKTNRQPVLVMVYGSNPCIYRFEDHFGVHFRKHPSTMSKK